MVAPYPSETLSYLPSDLPAEEVDAIRELAALAVKGVVSDPESTVEPETIHEVAQTLLNGKCDTRTVMIFFMSLISKEDLQTIKPRYPADMLRAAHNVSIIRLLGIADNPKHPPIRKVLLRQLVLKVTHDVRVILVKIAGRLVVLRRAVDWPEVQRQRIAQETLEVVVPWCDALGLEDWRQELQELCFKYLSPHEYNYVLGLMQDHRSELEDIKQQVIDEVNTLLEKHKIRATVSGRVKTHYAVYRKMQTYKLEYEDVWDRVGIRILAHSIFECYYIMMAIEEELYPDRRRFVDYIETPRRPYKYQSLHLTVCGPRKTMVEFQIRTYDMHVRGEFGVAAHWKMYGGGDGAGRGEDEKFAFLRTQASKLLGDPLVYLGNTLDTLLFNNSIIPLDTDGYLIDPDTGERVKNSRGEDLYYRDAKTDQQGYILDPYTEKPIHSHNGEKIWYQSEILPDRVIVYTPNGDLKSLPKGATPLDFAYYIHEDVGNTCVGAKVNGKLEKLDYELNIGDRVEVITRKGAKPSLDWLYNGMTRTRRANEKIKRFFREKSPEVVLPDSVDLGKAIVQKRLSAQRIRDLDMSRLVDMLRMKSERDMLEAIGSGEISVAELDAMLGKYVLDELQKSTYEPVAQTLTNTELDLVYVQAQCCLPVPGDEVVSYISQGKGFSLHRLDCRNIQSLDSSRIRPFQWSQEVLDNRALMLYLARLTLLVVEPTKTILQIKDLVSMENLPLEFIKMRGTSQLGTYLELVFKVAHREQIERLMRRLNASNDILMVRRTAG